MTTLYVDNIAPNLQSNVSIPGHVIQVVSVSSDTSTDTTGDYPQASGITASITPSATSSKIYVVVNVQSSLRNTGSNANKIGLFGIKNNTSGTELNRSRLGAELSAADKDFFAPRALADYLECVRNPETIRSICEDYRAAASIDLKDDDISRKQNLKIKMPTLVLWGKKGKIEQWYDPLTIWQKYCDQEVRGYGVNTGHYLAEENPDVIIKSINNFF